MAASSGRTVTPHRVQQSRAITAIRASPTEASLVEVRQQEGEGFEALLRRFTKRVQQDGLMSEARRRQHFEAPSALRKKQAAAKRRKSIKATLKYM